MSRTAAILCVLSLALGGTATVVCAEIQVGIEVTPQTINSSSAGKWVTVRAEILFSDVEDDTVYLASQLGSCPAVILLSDLHGNLVAKFSLTKVKDILDLGADEASLELSGETTNGAYFWGVDTVTVIGEVPEE